MTIDKRLLRERNKMKHSRPKFRRQESWRYKRVKPSWRRPSGIDNKLRHHKRGWPKIVRNGFRGPKAVRGLTSIGKEEVLVHNVEEISLVNKESQVARIASAVGVKKKINMTNKADELGIKIINRPEEALTFATISEISEELLLEDEDFAKETKKSSAAPRKKKPTASKDLTEKEIEELEKIEAQLAGKTAKKTTTPKTTTPKSTAPKTATPKKTTTTTEKKPATSTTPKKAATTTTTKTTTPKKTTTTDKSSTAKSPASKTTTSKTTSSKKAADTTTKAASTKKKE